MSIPVAPGDAVSPGAVASDAIAASLPPLPAHMVGHPFGADEAGRPITHTKGHVIRGAVEYMLECVVRRAAASLPPEIGGSEREAHLARARAAALEELLARINATIRDPLYHVSAEYLLDEAHSYSTEFDAFLCEICRQMSGDPHYHFNRAAKTIPASLAYLGRPFSLAQVYKMLPRLVSKFAEADMRPVRTGPGLAVIQYYATREMAELPEGLRQIYLLSACQHAQGALAQIPRIVYGLPVAEVREIRCQLQGAPCCEWEFTWQEPRRRGLSRLLPWIPIGQREPEWEPARSGGEQARLDAALAVAASANGASTPTEVENDLLPLPPHMAGRPFGPDEQGRPIRQANGASILGVIVQMQEWAGQRAAQGLPASAGAAERQAAVAQARETALNALVERLNAAIPDRTYHVTREYLLNGDHYYSHEFNLYANEFAREICGDPEFYYHRGVRSIPTSFIHVARPLSLTQIYRRLPSLAAKVTQTDVRTVVTTADSAVLQWHPGRQFEEMPAAIHRRYIRMACRAYQGAYAAIPRIHSNLPLARIKELHCLLHGDPYCEWEFTWEVAKPRVGFEVWGGVLASLLLLAALVLRLAPWSWLAGIAVLLPVTVGVMAWQLKRVRFDRNQQRRLLLDQRDSAEKNYDELQKASADLQLSNAALQHRLAQLTALHEIGLVTGATLDLQQLLETSLHAVTTHLGFDRALVLLVDEEQRLLAGGRSVGGTPEVAAAVREMAVSLDNESSFLSQAVRLGRPVLVVDATQVADEQTLRYVQALKAHRFMAVPLLMHGAALGVLAVDNTTTDRPVTEDSFELLMTVGNQIASAIDRVRLYQTLEQRVTERTRELAGAVDQLQREIAERRRMEESVRESERRMADIISLMPDAVVVIDQDGKVVAWNHAIQEMTGVKAEDMLGKGDYEYALPFYGERRPILIDLVTTPQKELEQNYSQIRMEGQILVGETYVPQLREGGAYLLGTASPLRDSRGQIVGAIEVIRDFTERKRMEEDLRQAKEVAEAATQAKSAFLATMSHEIRTPMNAVIGMTGLLLDTPLTAEQHEFAETIRTSGDSLLTIINDILDFSKIEAGRMELESQPFDLRECVESAVDLLAGRAAEKGLELGCVLENDVPAAIIGDVTRLRQILVNLLSNAVKFTEKGEVVVTVTADGGKTGKTASLHFAVRDTGIGIPPERMKRLFQSFSQVDASTTRRFGGTGLGLAISRRLTELMGGTMWVESPAAPPLQVGGPGSIFHFTVRAEVAPVPTARTYPQGIQPRLEGKRVLVVDDNPTNRRILSLQTQAWGMLPHQTGSPTEALDWLRRGDPFDVAFLDLQMPDMDGVALAGEIRRLREGAVLPLVILSSLGKREAQAEEGDWAAFLLKPIKASQLYNALAGIFGSAVEEALADQAVSPPQFEAGMGQRHPLRILLAEDNLVNQKLALRLLERMGYRADVAANGLEVLQSLRRQPYDVILMDVQMPEMDGLEASRAIWGEWPAECRPRIVAMTANVMAEDRQECLAAGMDDFIAKPIRVDELVGALSRTQPLAGRGRAVGGPGREESATDSTPPAALLDPAALERLRETAGGDAGFLNEMVETFLADAPGMVAEMRQAVEQGDPATLRRAAHSLKSNSADFGATALADLCRELEMMGKAGSLEGATEVLASAEAEWKRVMLTLSAALPLA